jgi:spoIIIJ-associated protein
MTGSAPDLVDGPESEIETDTPQPVENRKLADLEQEGEIAADYLEALLDIVDMDGDLDLDVEAGRAVVAALQELTRLAVLQKTGVRSRLMLDIGGHRARRREELRGIASAAANRVVASGTEEKLAPMSPFERKVVHDTVATVDGVRSESEGEEPNRRVVVLPA